MKLPWYVILFGTILPGAIEWERPVTGQKRSTK